MQNKQIIPDGWKIQKLGDLATVERGKFSVRPRNDPAYYGGNMPFVQTGDVSNSRVYLNNYSQSLNDKGILVSKVFQPDTILITIAANIGDTAITKFPVACPDSIVAIYGKDVSIYWLNSALRVKKGELESCATQNAQKNINLEILRPLEILTPPLEEQEKIAQILATWDSAIEQLTDLIAEKQHQKKALMQRLLTGKQRLPGFNKPWKKQLLNDLFKIYKGRDLSKNLVSISGKHKCILYGEIYTKYSEVIREVVSKTDANLGVPSISGDILVPASTTTQGIDLAKASVVLEDNVLLGGDINILRKKSELSSEFFSYALTNVYNFNIAKLTQGITIVHLYPEHLKGLVLYVPELSEQKAIADVLMAADTEIDLLQQQLQAITEQKQGLMQQLLTGNIRVKIDKK